MEYLHFEEDEIYETQCGEMFFTSKGRLIFHCTLCENRFYGFETYEIHLKEHIPFLLEEDKVDSTKISIERFVEVPMKSTTQTNAFEHSEEEDYAENNSFESHNEYKGSEASEETTLRSGENQSVSANEESKSEISEDENYFEETTRKPVTASKLRTDETVYDFETTRRDQKAPTATKEKVSILDKPPRRIRYSLQLESEIAEYKKKFKSKKINSNKDNQESDMQVKNIGIPKVVRAVKTRFSQRSLLISNEERKHKCPVCNVAFKDKHNMIHHLKRHSDNKDHKCPECDKRFFTTSEVNVHLKSHKNERPFLCNICGKSFAYNNQMLTHFKRHTNQRNHKCEICGKAFFDSYLLRNHMVGHSSLRPFSCVVCNATFARRRTLINHSKLHQNKREYKCALCDSRFNQQAGVNSHMRTAHKMHKVQ